MPTAPRTVRPLTPDRITDRNGREVPLGKVCERDGCDKPTKRGRKYCGKSCAGLATTAKNREAKASAATS